MSWLRRQQLIGYLFIFPSVTGVLIFFFFPLLFSIVLGFTDWQGPSGEGTKFIGFNNYHQLIQDSVFITSIKNTGIFLLHVPVAIIFAFVVAIILNRWVYMKKTLRAMFFLPYITSSIAIAFVWMLLFHPTQGPINEALLQIGISTTPGWLSSTDTSMYAINIIQTWYIMGFNVVIYLAALQNVSPDLEESAKIDGAGFWRITRYITFPLVSPITFFLLIFGFISAFKSFGMIQALTGGGPGDSTTILALYVYQKAFRYYDLGYASAVALILFCAILLVTLIQWYGQKKWVHY